MRLQSGVSSLGNHGYIDVDTSRAISICRELGKDLSEENFKQCLKWTVIDTARREVKKLIRQETPKDYAVTSAWAGSKVKPAKISADGGGGTSCVVPIRGERGTLGGIFSASGGGYAAGRGKKNGKVQKQLKSKKAVRAKILKGKVSNLPEKMRHQGGNAPFRMPNGVVVTRRTKSRLPIVSIVGRAVPQMVDVKFEKRIEKPLNDYVIKRFDQNAKRFLKV